MSFKNLNDHQRRRALVPFLQAAESITGHVVAVIATKELVRLSTGQNTLRIWQTLHGLSGNWNPKVFETLCRIAHIFSLLLAAWSRPGMHVSWITDQDDIVANERRLDDAQQLTSMLSSLYLPHNLGEFAMNTAEIEPKADSFEDFVAIPDLAAGMLAEIVTKWSSQADWSSGYALELSADHLSDKSNIIADWFYYPSASLKKTSILIDRFDEHRFIVEKLDVTR